MARAAAPDNGAPSGIRVTGRFTASAELLRRAKVYAEAGDVAQALKVIDGVVQFLRDIRSHSWERFRSLNGLAQTDLGMIADIGISAITQLAGRLRGGPKLSEEAWARAFREFLYARPVLEVLAGDVPLAKSKFAQDVNNAANTAMTAVAVVAVAAVALPLIIEGAPLIAEIAMEATPRLTIAASENPALAHLLSEFVVGKVIQVVETHAITFTVGELILLGLQVGGTVNLGSARVTSVNPDGSAELEITEVPTASAAGSGGAKGGSPSATGATGEPDVGSPTNVSSAVRSTTTPTAGGATGAKGGAPSTTAATADADVSEPTAVTSASKGTSTTAGGSPAGSTVAGKSKVGSTGGAATDTPETAVATAKSASRPGNTPAGATGDTRPPTPRPPMRRPTPNSVYTSTEHTTKRSAIPNPVVERRDRLRPAASLDPSEDTAGKIKTAQHHEDEAQTEHGNLPARQHEKTVSAGEGGRSEISGYLKIPERKEQTTVEQVLEHSREIGYPIPPHMRDPRPKQPPAVPDASAGTSASGTAQGAHETADTEGEGHAGEGHAGEGHAGEGQYYAGHAEKKQIVARPNTPVGVSRPMCADCMNFFRREAAFRGKEQVVSDPEATRVFDPDGQTVTEYWRDGSVVRHGPNGAQAEPSRTRSSARNQQ
jgi:hypothetical protein